MTGSEKFHKALQFCRNKMYLCTVGFGLPGSPGARISSISFRFSVFFLGNLLRGCKCYDVLQMFPQPSQTRLSLLVLQVNFCSNIQQILYNFFFLKI